MKNLLKKQVTLYIILTSMTLLSASNTLTMQSNEFTTYTLHGKEYLIKTSALKNIEDKRQEISNSNSFSNFSKQMVSVACGLLWGNILGGFFIEKDTGTGKPIGTFIGGVIGKGPLTNNLCFLR
jgi:hypothetical protein